MKYKQIKIFILIIIYCLAINYTKAQVHYTYDASGNRTSRWVDVTPVPYHASSNDTTVEPTGK